MSQVENFLSAEEEQEVIQTILRAESHTSGEIRVHLESSCQAGHYKRAREVFHLLKMDNTKDENSVLIYIAVCDKKFVIIGDKGINKVVPQEFWNSTKDLIQTQFQKGNFKQGIIDGVLSAGKELETHFPWQHGDENELSDEISKA